MGRGRAPILGAGLRCLVVAMLVVPAGSMAARVRIDIARGTVAQAALRIGQQGGLSVAIHSARGASRPVPHLRGTMEPRRALEELARLANLELRTVSARAYILQDRQPPPLRRQGAVPWAKPPAILKPYQPSVPVAHPEIVVTASKRDTTLREFAGQWSVIRGQELEGWAPIGSEAIEARNVGFSSTHFGAGRNKLFIRGIGDSSFSGPTQAPVGQYIGDVRTGYSGPDPDLRLVDMASIEVLEGPQGTLYGAGSLGGIVLLKPAPPQPGLFTGQINAGASFTQHGSAGGDLSTVINVPVADKSALRFVAYRVHEGGYIDNPTAGERNINKVNTAGLRASVTAPLNGAWQVEFNGLGQNIRGADSQYADADGPPLTRPGQSHLNFGSDFRLASVALAKPTGAIRARSTTGITSQRVREKFDASLPSQARTLLQSSSASSVSHETRIWRPMTGGFSWLAGFSGLGHSYSVGRRLLSSSLPVDLAGVENHVREATVFGEAGLEVGSRVTLTGGARLTRTTLSGRGRHLYPSSMDESRQAEAERSETRLLPSLSLLVRPTNVLVLYGRYQEGFRPGGLSLNENFVRRFRNDRVSTVETGFRLRDGAREGVSLRGNITHSRWQNIQADFIDGQGLPSTANIGDGRVWSAGLNATVHLRPGFRFESGLAWNNGKVLKANPALLSVGRGGSTRIPNIARFVARAGLNSNLQMHPDLSLRAGAYVRYVGRSRLGIGPKLGESQGSYFDSGASLRLGSSRRAVSLTATNLTDEVGNRFALGTPFASDRDQITPLRPRSIRIGFETAF